MAYPAVSRRRVRRLATTLVAVVCVVTSCSYDPQEPGLFGRETEDPTAVPTGLTPSPTEDPPPGNRELPVVGDAVWTSGDGLDITVRWAVHAVRRMRGATVLDWSVTPLSGRDLHVGDRVPSSVNLGLTRFGEGDTNVFLIDADAGRVYRPLTRRGSDDPACLCTPVALAQGDLRIGSTTLLQTTYPAIPRDVFTIDVDIATVPMFSHVPITPVGMVPLAGNATDLNRPIIRFPATAGTPVFGYGPGGQQFIVTIDTVSTSNTFTSVAWSIQSITSGRGLETADQPPFADAQPPAKPYNLVSAGGPQLLLATRGRPKLRSWLATTRLAGRDALECLCSDLRLWPSMLRRADAKVSVVTNLPPIPRQFSSVDIALPGVATLPNVGVTRAPDSTYRSAGPQPYQPSSWPAGPGLPQHGWDDDAWPTPLPRADQLADFQATVDRIIVRQP